MDEELEQEFPESDYENDNSNYDNEMENDILLERQELEDFEQVDEYFGSHNDDDAGW